MSKKKKLTLTVVIAVLTLISSVVCYFLLPETVAVQWKLGGETANTLPRLGAVAAAAGVGALMLITSWTSDRKWTIYFSFIGVVMQILFVLTNLGR